MQVTTPVSLYLTMRNGFERICSVNAFVNARNAMLFIKLGRCIYLSVENILLLALLQKAQDDIGDSPFPTSVVEAAAAAK